jgi:hypothetical protein
MENVNLTLLPPGTRVQVFSTIGSGDNRIRLLNVSAMTVSTVAGNGERVLSPNRI